MCAKFNSMFFPASFLLVSIFAFHPAVASASGSGPGWELVDSDDSWSRQSHAMAYDAARDALVMFGGRDAGLLGDTWEYNGYCWLEIAPDHSPPARFWHSMVYDSNRRRIVLFGGGDPDNQVYYNDTWEYDGNDWQQIFTPHSPPPRLVRTMAFDSARNRTVLTGGGGPGVSYNDTWEYDGIDWVQVDTGPEPPRPGALAAMAYDAARQRMVLTFENGTEPISTWEYDGATWVEMNMNPAPLGRWVHVMAYNACSQRVVLSGGYSPHHGSGATMDDTWEYNGIEWTQVLTSRTPAPLSQPAMAYDSTTGRVIMNARGQTWAYTSPFHDVELCGLLPGRPDIRVEVDSPNMVLESKPPLINIPHKTLGVPLTTSLLVDDVSTPLDPSLVAYEITHPVHWRVTDPEAIISVDAGGVAHYNSEGFVTARATSIIDSCPAKSDELILATGEVYGDPQKDNVIAVFPPDFTPPTSTYSFGDMISRYPDMMRIINLAYDTTSGMYRGFRPFDGDKQILALLDVEGHCGAADNPLQTAPQCYMNYGDASPQYGVVIHEMGHNFSKSEGMQQLLFSEGAKIATNGFSECVASLPVIYFEAELALNGEAYGVYPGSFEYQMAQRNRAYFCPDSQAALSQFEQMIRDGQIEGIFDNDGMFDGVKIFCGFFDQFSCPYIDGENLFRHQMIRRFLHVFSDRELPGFVPEKVETYFAAAYSAAAGRDMRTRLDFWGFTIDNAYYEHIGPIIAAMLDENADIVFSDGFEGGGNP